MYVIGFTMILFDDKHIKTYLDTARTVGSYSYSSRRALQPEQQTTYDSINAILKREIFTKSWQTIQQETGYIICRQHSQIKLRDTC